MKGTDQNNAIVSLEKALVPGAELIDGRTETDRLWFFSEFASLINFYDSSNTVNGNWAPFLLKDPVFLMAAIAKTKIADFKSPFLNACILLQKIKWPLAFPRNAAGDPDPAAQTTKWQSGKRNALMQEAMPYP